MASLLETMNNVELRLYFCLYANLGLLSLGDEKRTKISKLTRFEDEPVKFSFKILAESISKAHESHHYSLHISACKTKTLAITQVSRNLIKFPKCAKHAQKNLRVPINWLNLIECIYNLSGRGKSEKNSCLTSSHSWINFHF